MGYEDKEQKIIEDFPKELTLAKAINYGLDEAMNANEKVILLGEDIGRLGGVFRVTEGLMQKYGNHRVLDTPLSESGIIGTAIGLAMRGYRPVCEIQFDGFIFPAMDQITSQLAKLTNRMSGFVSFPLVIRVPYGGHIGAVEHHQESPEAYFAHTSGIRILSPSTSNDAYWMIQQAVQSEDPVMFFEPKSRYWSKSLIQRFEPDKVHPEIRDTGYVWPRARIVKSGSDVTLIGHGAMVSQMLLAAEVAEEEGISVEVVDLRSLAPIDYETLVVSACNTGRVIVSQEAPENASLGSTIAAKLTEKVFYNLNAPIIRLSGFDAPFPPAKLEGVYLPSADRILDAIDKVLSY